jgi:hypothetical protein
MNDGDDRVRILFEQARRERPARGVEARVLAACRAELARPAPGLGRRMIVLAVAAPLAVAAGVTLVMARRDVEPPIAPTAERVATSARPAAVEKRAPSAPAPLPSASADSSKRAQSAPRPAAPRVLSLTEEVAALDRARAEVGAGNPVRALALLDEYQRAPGTKRLHAEATLLRIEALSRQGRGAEAARLARRFIEKNPSSALADRAAAFARLGESETRSPKDSGGLP